jgi:hypothetical protein
MQIRVLRGDGFCVWPIRERLDVRRSAIGRDAGFVGLTAQGLTNE